jgi:VWFA-related protein
MRDGSKPRSDGPGGEREGVLTRLSLGGRPRGALWSAAPLALAVAAAAQQAPVFPSRVELIAVDVTVVDGKGRPIADLAPEDFAIEVGGRPRRVVSAEYLKHAELPEPGPPPAPAPSAAPAFTSNLQAAPGRLIVLAPDIGNLSVGGARGAAEAGRRFLDRLTPADRVALVTLPVGARVDFTSDFARLREALGKLMGGGLDRVRGMKYVSLAEAFSFRSRSDRRYWNAAVSRECAFVKRQEDMPACESEVQNEAIQLYNAAKGNTDASVASLRGLIRGLGRIEGPKTLVLISQALITGGSMGEPGTDRALAVVADDAAAARVTLHTILIDRSFLELIHVSEREAPATPSEDRRLMADGLEAVTGYAGGQLYRVTVLADPAFERLATESSGTWLLAFEPEPGDRDGKAHPIKVKVAREKVHVRSRPQFVAGPAGGLPTDAGERARLALAAPLTTAGRAISLTTYALGQRGGDGVELLVAAEVDGAPTPDLALAWRVTDEEGKVVGGAASSESLPPVSTVRGPAGYFSASVVVKSGTYRVKVAVADAAGRAGSVEHVAQARFTKGGTLALSNILLAEPERRAGDATAVSVDGALLGRVMTAYVELRGEAAAGPPSVRFEVVPEGESAAPALATPPVAAISEAAGRYAVEAGLDLSRLAPGAYRLRAIALDAGGIEAGRVERPLRLAPRP